MKNILDKLMPHHRVYINERLSERDQYKRQVDAIYGILVNLYGADKLVLRASKLEALNLMRSEQLEERLLGLQKIVFNDPTIDILPKAADVPGLLEDLQEEVADEIARRSVEDTLEKKIAEKMQQRHEEYVKEIKMQLVKESTGPETPQTLKRLEQLEKMESVSLARSAMAALRPAVLEEIVGQERAVQALVAKVSSPYPQHIILYGPPGVGKTTAARLALDAVKKLGRSSFEGDAPFVEVDGTTLRWDPREVTNPLMGSVHDPIYQGARRDLAEGGIPEPKLGLVSEAHGGVLFIDEIGEIDPLLLNKLLKVLEDKRVNFDSSYYDPNDPQIPQYIRKIFEEGAPADFILIGATTRDAAQLNPALRSRCAEIYFEPLTPVDIKKIVLNAAARLGVEISNEVAEAISEYTIEGRKAINILADAYGLTLFRQCNGRLAHQPFRISREDLNEVIQISRLSPYVQTKSSPTPEIGKVLGLGVAGFVGSLIEIEVIAFPAREAGKGQLRFNDTAGSMAKDSVFNAASVFRKLTGEELGNYDCHINVIGGGNIEGPSAGAAILTGIISAVRQLPVRQDMAITGEISIQGKIKPVGGIPEKIYGAKQAEITTVLVPIANEVDIPSGLKGIEVYPVATIEEVLTKAIVAGEQAGLVS